MNLVQFTPDFPHFFQAVSFWMIMMVL